MNKYKKYQQFLLPFFTVILFFAAYIILHGVPFVTQAQSSSTATFGVIGDTGASSNASAVFSAVSNANLNFFLHVGDFSYDEQGGPSGWPGWVKGIVGTVLPFEIVSGNHDDCCIDTYVQGLPNKMANLQGTYGKNYFFDYPQTSALVRVIMISPGGFDPDIAWLSSAIDTARSSGIPWVVVGMHRNCITTGQKSCEVGSSVLNLLLSKKVDIILQGHDHNYQRSKQLSCANVDTTTQSCIVNATSSYTKGAGTVIIIDGAGGNGLYAVDSGDSEAGYFATINSDTYGFTKFTVSATQLSGQFVRAAGGNLSDSFTISGTSTGTTPGLTPTGITPTYGCVGGINCVPSLSPTIAVNPSNTTASPNPSTSTSPGTSVNPCLTASNSIADRGEHRGKHHRKNRGRNRGFLSRFMAFLFQLIMQLLKQLGIQVPDGTFPTPTPSTSPSPSTEPGTSATPCPSTNP